MNRFNGLLIVFTAFILLSCNPKKSVDSLKPVSIAQLKTNPSDYLDKRIVITGTVSHVCREGGQKMFLYQNHPESLIRITTGPSLSEFTIDLEGKEVEVTGIFRQLKIDEAYLTDLEKGQMNDKGHTNENPSIHKNEPVAGNIQRLRERIAASGSGYITDQWIEAESFTVLSDKN